MTKKSKLDEVAEYVESHDLAESLESGVLESDSVPATAAMAGFNTRFPVSLLAEVRDLAAARGMETGAWIREAVEAAVAQAKGGSDLIPLSVLLAAAEEYRHRRAS